VSLGEIIMTPIGEGLVSFDNPKQIGIAIPDFPPLFPHGIVVLGKNFLHLGGGKIQKCATEPSINHIGRHRGRERDALGQNELVQ